MRKESSEQVLALLDELAGLRMIDSPDRPRTRLERAERKECQCRRKEIGRQIKEIAKKKRMKNADEC
jgi:hypothetical protein